ncbi:NADP-dependent oxidoreductase [Aspergillus mulundensis]|uniref:Enoyl reductase (ER) domain-containing protein n=1 Tax=Aspergillus mulundensis TaxID=1810919 RepID=A0A3D8RYH9_9EURO|nr:Uncharacterized protein DSM5745_05733 [Aspergillus mulundensis]RDW78881.1 Uncharacterized protein DSM5745_05733 [Aspergillus mulundensis]
MNAIRIHPAPNGETPYSASNPAPPSALHLDTIPIPKLSRPNELLVRVKASTIVRDTLTWPESYTREYLTPGNDIAGTVVEVFDPQSNFNVGDEVFGMLPADQPGSWAEYVIVRELEVALKPKRLSWYEAAAMPLSALTAFEALFVRGGVVVPSAEDALCNSKGEQTRDERGRKKVLVTGAAGAVGMYVVQLARLAGVHVTAATSSNERNARFLSELGADETIEYAALQTAGQKEQYDIVIDTVGGQTLVKSWACVKTSGALVTVDSSSFNFVKEHQEQGFAREDVRALFFIVEGGRDRLETLARFAELGMLRVFVLDVYGLQRVRDAYERASGRLDGRGKIVLSV